jgi:SLT domain-containing protein
MAVNAGSVYVDLGARLDRREFEAYDRELKKVRERVARREQFKAQLGGDFDPRAFNAYEREIRKSHKATEDMVNATGRFRTAFGTVWGRGGAALAAFGSIDLVKRGIESITSAYADSQVSQQKMATQLKALNISYQEHAKQIDEVIQRTSKLAGLDDEDLQDAFTNIVRATGKVSESLKLTGLAADLARAKHIDVAKAGQLLGRVATGNVTALSRYGVTIDKSATSTEALAAVQRKFGGQAAAYGRTQAGASDRVQVAWENLRETLGQKLSPALTRAMNGVARFVNQMQDGTGAGGKFIDMLQRAGRNFQLFGQHVQDDIHMISGWVTSAEGATSTALHWTGTLVGGSAGRKLKQWGDNVDANRQTIDRWRQEMTIKREVDKIDSDLDRLRNKTSGTLHGILTATHRNMAEIRKTMGTESAAGQQAIHDNFQAAVTAIRRAMRNGEISTKTGLAQIRSDMLQELRELGISSALRGGKPLSKNPPKGDLPVTTDSAPVTKYGGGWIGAPGMVGPDVVPAMLAPGEAVLNRHQQAVIEGMLGDGFLDRLFATVSRPHYMDRGGRIPFAAGGLAPAVSRLANSLVQKFGLTITSTTGGTHAPGSFHYQGLAADLGGPPAAMNQAAEWIKSSGTYRSLLEGIHNPNLAVKNGQLFSGAGPFGSVWGAHANHVHIALRALGAIAGGGGLDAAVRAIRAPQVGGSGALHDIVQGVLDRTARGATSRVRSLASSMGGGDTTSQGVAGKGSTAQVRAWVAAGLRLAGIPATPGNVSTVAGRVMQESGGDPNAQNNWDINAKRGDPSIGLLQTIGATFRQYAVPGHTNIRNPVDNVAAAVRYMMARYGHLVGPGPGGYARGGFARFAKGGKAGKLPKLVGKATAGLVRRTPATTVDNSSTFNAIMARVDAIDADYQRHERRFNISDEELVDADTGQLNTPAIQRKVKELTYLLIDRRTQEQELNTARAFARNLIRSYKRIVTALRRSLRHAKGKDRTGIRGYISTYDKRIGEWKGKVGELGDTIFDTHTDLLEVQGELADVQSTQPNIPTPDAPDTSGDTGTPDAAGTDTPSVETPTPPTAADIAAGVIQELANFNQGRADLLSAFAPNFVSQRQAYMPGGAFSGSPDALTAAGGVRFFGAGGNGSLGGLAGASVTAHFASAPPDPPSFVQQVRFLVENGSAG